MLRSTKQTALLRIEQQKTSFSGGIIKWNFWKNTTYLLEAACISMHSKETPDGAS